LWKNRNKRVGLCVTVMAGCLILAILWAVLVIPKNALAKKPDKPPVGDDDVFKDMPLCIKFGDGEITPSENPLCASTEGVTAFAGRNRTITLSIHKRTEDPNLVLSLGPKLVADTTLPDVDPDPAADGGYFDGPGQPECPPPILGSGRLYEPELQVGISVNVKDIDPETPLMTNGRLIFIDDVGQEYQLLWGKDPQPGGFQRTNPSAPDISIYRNPDDVEGKRNWDVDTNPEIGGEQEGAHTAFLWWVLSPHGAHDYCGAYDVSFNYIATEE
jgi:hypothetical protein